VLRVRAGFKKNDRQCIRNGDALLHCRFHLNRKIVTSPSFRAVSRLNYLIWPILQGFKPNLIVVSDINPYNNGLIFRK